MKSTEYLIVLTYLAGVAMIIGAIILIINPPSAAAADWPQSEFNKAPPQIERKYSRAKGTFRKRRAPRVKAWVRKHRHLNAFDDKNSGCKPEIKVTGTQFLSENGAKERAQKAWEGMVQFRHGELYADLRFARDIRYQCVRSSVENIANRASEAVGINTQLKRCLIWATPCIAPLTK